MATPARVSNEPGLGEVLVTAEDLQRRVAELGREITADYAGRPLLLVGVLKLKTFGTMLLSIVLYATQWGAPFAIGFVLLIFVHEMGHVVVLRHEGIPAGAPVFIPFLGAFIAMKFPPEMEGDPGLVYLELLTGGHYFEKPEEIAEYQRALTRLHSLAASPEASRGIIERRLKEVKG